MSVVKCESCHQIFQPYRHNESGWQGDIPNLWLCDRCINISQANYEASMFDVDRHESELAEMEY